MGTVHKFPEQKSRRAQALKQQESKRAFLTLSLLSLIVGTVWLNSFLSTPTQSYTIVYNENPNSVRGIASDSGDSHTKDIKWEHGLADQMRNMSSYPNGQRSIASVIQGITPADRIKYSEIQGHYTILYSTGADTKVKEIFFNAGEQNLDPITINTQNFLMKYKEGFAVTFETAIQIEKKSKKNKRENASAGNEKVIYDLMLDSKSVGKAIFELDSTGHFLSLKFK